MSRFGYFLGPAQLKTGFCPWLLRLNKNVLRPLSVLHLADKYIDVTNDSNVRTKEESPARGEMTLDHGAWLQSECDV